MQKNIQNSYLGLSVEICVPINLTLDFPFPVEGGEGLNFTGKRVSPGDGTFPRDIDNRVRANRIAF